MSIRHEFIHTLNTFACADNEVYISGTDNKGDQITIVIPANEVLEWVDMEYVREKVIEHYTQINREHIIDDVREKIVDRLLCNNNNQK